MRISDQFFGTYLNTCIFDIEAEMCLQSCQDAIRRCILIDNILKFIISKRDTNYVLNYPLSDFDRYQNCCINYNCYLRFALN